MNAISDTRIDAASLCQSVDLPSLLGWSERGFGPCFNCGGKDRFVAFSSDSDRTYLWCRRCNWHGDAIALVMALHGLDFLSACDFLRRDRGICTPARSSMLPVPPPRRVSPNTNGEHARSLWREAILIAAGDAADTYMREIRGITIPLPATLRHALSLWHNPSKSSHPALIAAISLADGAAVVGVQRQYLAQDGRGKARAEPNRMMLGLAGGGSVHLAPATPELAVAEGVESALSFMEITSIPTWAALSTSGLVGLELPPLPLAERIWIAADRDVNGAGQVAAERAAERWWREGRTVRISMPPEGYGDWNDLLREVAR